MAQNSKLAPYVVDALDCDAGVQAFLTERKLVAIQGRMLIVQFTNEETARRAKKKPSRKGRRPRKG